MAVVQGLFKNIIQIYDQLKAKNTEPIIPSRLDKQRCREVRTRNQCPTYDTKQSDGEAPVMLALWGMRSTPSLPSFPGSLWPRVVTPGRVLSMGKIELNYALMLNWIALNKTVLTF